MYEKNRNSGSSKKRGHAKPRWKNRGSWLRTTVRGKKSWRFLLMDPESAEPAPVHVIVSNGVVQDKSAFLELKASGKLVDHAKERIGRAAPGRLRRRRPISPGGAPPVTAAPIIPRGPKTGEQQELGNRTRMDSRQSASVSGQPPKGPAGYALCLTENMRRFESCRDGLPTSRDPEIPPS